MSRIGTFGASQLYLSRLSVIQTRLNKTQIQVSTELKSTVYSGIAGESNRVINLENEKARADAFVRDHAHGVTQARGGEGAAREFCELIMRAQGTLAAAQNAYL